MQGFGNLIKLYRISKNYSQEYMAYKLKISQSTYSRIENDIQEPTLIQLKELADVLEFSVDKVLNGLKDMKIDETVDTNKLLTIAKEILLLK